MNRDLRRIIDQARVAAMSASASSANREYGGFIFLLPNGDYAFTPPIPGKESGISGNELFLALQAAYLVFGTGAVPIATYHTHGSDEFPAWENFSPDDSTGVTSWFRYFGRSESFIGSVLFTPSGTTKLLGPSGLYVTTLARDNSGEPSATGRPESPRISNRGTQGSSAGGSSTGSRSSGVGEPAGGDRETKPAPSKGGTQTQQINNGQTVIYGVTDMWGRLLGRNRTDIGAVRGVRVDA